MEAGYQGTSTGLSPRTASILAYLAGPFSGFLILRAESRDEDVRFHAWQSIVGLGGLGAAVCAAYLLGLAALFVSAPAVSVMVALASLIWIVLLIVWAISLFKAYRASDGNCRLPASTPIVSRRGRAASDYQPFRSRSRVTCAMWCGPCHA